MHLVVNEYGSIYEFITLRSGSRYWSIIKISDFSWRADEITWNNSTMQEHDNNLLVIYTLNISAFANSYPLVGNKPL